MPAYAADIRARSMAYLSGVIHAKYLALDSDRLLSGLKKNLDANKLRGKEAVIVAEVWRTFNRERKLPEAFVCELAETVSKAQNVWAQARAKNSYKMFLPWLEKIVALKREEAELVGYTESPYDALLDTFEPGMTSEEAYKILNDLKDFLVPFLHKIRASQNLVDRKRILGDFPLEKQKKFNELVAGSMGFDLTRGRIDPSAHPFTSGSHPNDIRITTRYRSEDVLYSLSSTIHEAGHALYEQGLKLEHFGTPLAESVSLGIHESQSRLWENNIGKSKSFWKYFYPKLQKEFPLPFKKLKLEEFYAILNEVRPSLIRTEADEVTYNLHIIIRFEIEKEMIEGSLDLRQLPKIWRSKMKDYLGIDVPSDSMGVLQDVHWSCGYIGYFPTYSFGNLYAAQFHAAMAKDIANLPDMIAAGELQVAREWLRKHVHVHGKTFGARDLVRRVTSEELNSRYFNEYIQEKYSKIYRLR